MNERIAERIEAATPAVADEILPHTP